MKYRCVTCHCSLLLAPGMDLDTVIVTVTVKFNRLVKYNKRGTRYEK